MKQASFISSIVQGGGESGGLAHFRRSTLTTLTDDQARREQSIESRAAKWFGREGPPRENPLVHPHPEDDLDALNLKTVKQEANETTSDFVQRRADELKQRNDAQLSQIATCAARCSARAAARAASDC